MAFCVRRMLQDYPADTLSPGDAIICNDPGIGAGHLPDLYMISPVFHEGALVAFAVNIAHQIDIGGSGAGSQTITGIQDNFQEGLRFLPTRAFVKGEPVRDIFRVIEANVRVPEVRGDIRAQYTANLTGARRIEDLACATVSPCARRWLISRAKRRCARRSARYRPASTPSRTGWTTWAPTPSRSRRA
jgi:N-methylhydantoinase B